MDALKIGARNNRDDKARIHDIRACAKTITDHTMALEPDDEPDEEQAAPTKSSTPLPAGDALKSAAVKVAGEWTLDVLAIPWGKDADGQWFDENTDLMLDAFKTPAVIYYHGLDPSGKTTQANPEIIGTSSAPIKQSDGWHVSVILDKTKSLARRVWNAAQRGEARASSGTIEHMARILKDGRNHLYNKFTKGAISVWPMAELSLFDMGEGRNPANRFAVATPALKIVYDLAGMRLPDIAIEPETGGAPVVQVASKSTQDILGDYDMTPDEVQKAISDALAKVEIERAAKADADKAQAEIMTAAIKAERAKWEDEVKVSGRLPTFYAAKYSETWRFDNFTPGDLSFAAQVLQSAQKSASPALLKSLALKMENDKEAETAMINRQALKTAGIKADETDYTTNSLFGLDWVGTAYGSELWLTVRSLANVAGKVPVGPDIPQGYNSNTIPLESTDPIFYKVPEATDSTYNATTGIHNATVPANAIGTLNKNITVGKMGARTIFSGEMEEDSLVAFAANARRQMGICAAEAMDYVVINADSDATASTNINAIDTTPAATRLFLITNGFRKLALMTTPTNARSAAASLDVTDFVETLKLMGVAGRNAMAKEKVSFIVDLNTYWKALGLPEVLTKDINSQATIESGELTRMYGVDIIRSGFMHGGLFDYPSVKLLANAAGKVDADHEANNLYGAILAVRWDQWQMRYKRRWTLETVRRPESDTNEIVGLTRFGLGYRDGEAAALTYYVGV